MEILNVESVFRSHGSKNRTTVNCREKVTRPICELTSRHLSKAELLSPFRHLNAQQPLLGANHVKKTPNRAHCAAHFRLVGNSLSFEFIIGSDSSSTQTSFDRRTRTCDRH